MFNLRVKKITQVPELMSPDAGVAASLLAPSLLRALNKLLNELEEMDVLNPRQYHECFAYSCRNGTGLFLHIKNLMVK